MNDDALLEYKTCLLIIWSNNNKKTENHKIPLLSFFLIFVGWNFSIYLFITNVICYNVAKSVFYFFIFIIEKKINKNS